MSVKKFTVVESRWLRGKFSPFRGHGAESRLLDGDGAMCCMGFLAEACGVPEAVRRKAFYFSDHTLAGDWHLLPNALSPRPEGHDWRAHGRLAQRIYTVNDDKTINDDGRKEQLTALFALAGIEVEFVP